MLSADNARKALQYNFTPNNIKVSAPQPFSHGYDNYTGGMASIGNFNSLMRSPTNYPIIGNFGRIGDPQNLKSTFPGYNATWQALDFVISGGGLTRTWTGTAVTPGDVTIVIEVATLLFTGTLGAYGTISGQAVVNGGIASIVTGTLTINSFKNIFYGKISWGMSEDSGIAVNHQIKIDSYFDIIGNDYTVTLNPFKTLSAEPLIMPVDSLQGDVTGTASIIFMAGKNNVFFDGYIFGISN
jgi:hypothetical protein